MAVMVHSLPSTVDRAVRRQVDFERQLWTAFNAEPLEDGITHPAERIIEEFVRREEDAEEWLAELAVDDTSPAFAASVLRCLSRVAGIGSTNWRASLVRDACR